MGRYYSGDIEGKFWFGVQSSNDGEFFGAEEIDRNIISYTVTDINLVREKVTECINMIGSENCRLLEKFFDENTFYNDGQVSELLNINLLQTKDVLTWYARLHLGRKILKCMEEQGYCDFEAEV